MVRKGAVKALKDSFYKRSTIFSSEQKDPRFRLKYKVMLPTFRLQHSDGSNFFFCENETFIISLNLHFNVQFVGFLIQEHMPILVKFILIFY